MSVVVPSRPLAQHFTPPRKGLSFELFPPKSDAGRAELRLHLAELLKYGPDFVTCTYGAGGSTRQKTLEICTEVKQTYQVPVASHLTCVESTVDELRGYLTAAVAAGVDYIVALRGDPPKGQTEFRQQIGGLRYANELVSLIHGEFPQLGIAVAGYPEVHQEAPDAATDLANLKRKVDAGADVVITQLFYDNQDYFSFVENCRRAGIQIPIVPGILPVQSLPQVQRIAGLCKAKLPQTLVDQLARHADDEEAQVQVGIEHASRQVEELLQQGVPGVHFYVLNRSRSTTTILRHVAWNTAAV